MQYSTVQYLDLQMLPYAFQDPRPVRLDAEFTQG